LQGRGARATHRGRGRLTAAGVRIAGRRIAERFSAFSFVDQITDLEPGIRAKGRFTVPEAVSEFPTCLVAEAVGQLAAWVALAHLDFRLRPVAGIAREARFLGGVKPGQTLELEIELEGCDDDAVAYGGCARVDGAKVVELSQCVGPMLPLAEFDDPDAVRAQLTVLREAGAPIGRFWGVDRPEAVVIERSRGERLRAHLRWPESAAFFGDHFPRRPVLPGTLLLDSQMRLALELAAEATPGRPLKPARVTDVKIRSFIAPGQVVELEVAMLASAGANGTVTASLGARVGGKPAATARIEMTARGTP